MILSGTGHRPDKLGGWTYNNPVARWCYEQGLIKVNYLRPDAIITGGAMGWDQILANIAINLKIPLEVAIPFKGFEDKWSDYFKDIHRKILNRASKITYVCGEFSNSAYQRRNLYMVDSSDHLLALYDGTSGGTQNCYKYAKQIGKPITRIDPRDFNKSTTNKKKKLKNTCRNCDAGTPHRNC